ncbi:MULTISPECIES: hypothetical protein [Marinomonas]|uniref:Uncharacterized protein n=1 Tax=Marinomonas arctica TaxID=383750 RepID=A0A7H1J1H5_9GAMM|nr:MULTISPECIES: hypothetical protein [Marinomonas]MCS7488756.1 hypothetical protein [Marinomonas sp. BSi20414]QNT04341.1 hypothetical protein IBG28_11345 [Marinomonas arctica]GGN37577.1 hypothetical protein GCM10011350_36970 [Marinomonas arctica]
MKEKFKVPDSVIILACTLFGYMAVYLYELGYCKAFGIPTELINPSISNYLKVGGISIAVLVFLFQVLNLFHLIINESLPNSPYKTLLSKYGLFVILGLLVAVQSYFYWHTVIFFLGFPLLMLLVDVIIPLFDREGTYSNRLELWLSFNAKVPNKDLINEHINENNSKIILSVVLSIYILGVLTNFGYGEALRKEKFSIVGEYALLKVYGAQGIVMKFNSETNELLPEYKIVEMKNIEFKVVELGKLRQKDEK